MSKAKTIWRCVGCGLDMKATKRRHYKPPFMDNYCSKCCPYCHREKMAKSQAEVSYIEKLLRCGTEPERGGCERPRVRENKVSTRLL